MTKCTKWPQMLQLTSKNISYRISVDVKLKFLQDLKVETEVKQHNLDTISFYLESQSSSCNSLFISTLQDKIFKNQERRNCPLIGSHMEPQGSESSKNLNAK